MKLVLISPSVLVNPEHISHIKIEIMPNPTAGQENSYGHDYPVMIIAMIDGKEYEIHNRHSYVTGDSSYMFMSFERLLQSLYA